MSFETPQSFCVVEESYSCSKCSVFDTHSKRIVSNDATLSIKKTAPALDDFSSTTSGSSTMKFSDDYSTIESFDVSKAMGEIDPSSYVSLRKTADGWFSKLNNVQPPVREQVKSIIDGKTGISFNAGEVNASNSEVSSLIHRPQLPVTFPPVLLSVPLILPAILFFGGLSR